MRLPSVCSTSSAGEVDTRRRDRAAQLQRAVVDAAAASTSVQPLGGVRRLPRQIR